MNKENNDQNKINIIIENHKNNGLSENEIYNIILSTLKAFNNESIINYDGAGNTKYS